MVDLAADGGLDAVGNWHDTDGKFQKRGVSTAKALAVKAVRGLAAAATVKDRPDGADLDLSDRAPAKLVEKVGRRARVTWHDEKHGAVKVDGRRVLVPWTAFDDPPDAPAAPIVNEIADAPVPAGPTKLRTFDEAKADLGPQRIAEIEADGKANLGAEDTMMTAIQRSLGYDAPPQVGTADEVAKAVADGGFEFWRGVHDENGPDVAARYVEEFRTGHLFAGRGIYGSGTYVTADREEGETYAVHGRWIEGQGWEYLDKRTLLHGALKPGARIADADEIHEQVRAATADVTGGRHRSLFGDDGRFAALLGYDAIRDGNIVVVLNRAATIIEEAPSETDAPPVTQETIDASIDDGENDLRRVLAGRLNDAADTVKKKADAALLRRVAATLDPDTDTVDAKKGDADKLDALSVPGDRVATSSIMSARRRFRALTEAPTTNELAEPPEAVSVGQQTIPVSNELAIAPDDRVTDYVTPAVERWAEKWEVTYGNGRTGNPAASTLAAWREDPTPARAHNLFNALTTGVGSRQWIEQTLASPNPDPDAVSTLRMLHAATVYELGNKPHTFSRTNHSATDPFFSGIDWTSQGDNLGVASSWVRTDAPEMTKNLPDATYGPHRHDATFGPEQILANAGGMAAVGEYLITRDPETIPRLLRGEYPAARVAPNVNGLVEAPERPRTAVDDLPPPTVPDGLPEAEAAAEQAIRRLNEIHHEDVGINGVTLATLPTVAENARWRDRPLDPASQRMALDRLFRPNNEDGLITALPILDETDANRGRPLGAVAVNVETGAIVGTHAPWSADTAPPYGQWASLPADHPQAAALVTSAWLASPEVKRYIDTVLMPRLRQGYTTDPAFPGLTETIRRNSDSIAAPYRGHPDIAVSRVTGPDGTYYVPDPDGRQSIDGDEIRFADFSEDGGTRLWVSKIGVNEPDATARLGDLDYSTVDDDDLPWDERVAALAKVRAEITEIFGPDPSAMFSRPTEEDMRDLLVGSGGEREFAHIEALERFGESLEALVIQRERDAVAPEPSIDKSSVLAKLREIPGVPPALADLLEREPWDGQVVGAVLNPRPGAPNGGGRVDITFPDHPESRVMVFTSVRGTPPQTYVGWEFSASHQRDLGADEFVALPPSKMLTVSPGYAPFEWFDDLNESNPAAPRERGSTPTMAAWIDTMEALGVDMGNDPDVYFALGRDRDGEIGGQPERGANPIRYGDLSEEGILQHSAEVGMRAYPKAWTQRLGGRLIRIAVDDDRTRPVGASSSWPDVGVVDVANVDKHGEFADTLTHEFAHQFEQSIPGLMLLETWHFIKRLRAEAKRTQKLATWEWDDQRFGFVDEFGDQYMGRVYRNPHTGVTGVTSMGGSEIFSTASQTLWANEERNAADLDPQARRLFMGVMATIEPPGLDPDERWRP